MDEEEEARLSITRISSPDDIVIWYVDENGENKFFVYKGDNGDRAPNNDFVNKVLESICFNCSNGGGIAGTNAANIRGVNIEIVESDTRSIARLASGRSIVNWNPHGGLRTENGILSPSTVLEHEIDHALDGAMNPQEHTDRRNDTGGSFTNAEEERVILGNETITAIANGEIPPNTVSRRSHGGGGIETIYVDEPTSNEVNQERTLDLQQALENEIDSFTSEFND